MNKHQMIPLAILAMAAGSARGAEVYDQPVILGLTVSYNAPEVVNTTTLNGVVTYTEVGKAVTGRYSNREFLADMVEEGVIPSVDGWSIVFRTDSDGDKRGFFLKKLGMPDVEIEDRLELSQVSEAVTTYAFKVVDGATEETATESTLLKMRLGSLELDVMGIEAHAQGIVVETNSQWTATGTDPIGDLVPGMLTFQNFVGAYGDFDDDCDLDDDHGDDDNIDPVIAVASEGADDTTAEIDDNPFDDPTDNDDGLQHHGERNEDWGLIQGVTKLSRGRLILVQ